MAMEILNITIVMYHSDNGQRCYNPQTKTEKNANSSQKYSQMYLPVHKS